MMTLFYVRPNHGFGLKDLELNKSYTGFPWNNNKVWWFKIYINGEWEDIALDCFAPWVTE